MPRQESLEEEQQIIEEQTKHDALLETLGLRRPVRDLTGAHRPLTCGPQTTIRAAIAVMQRERKGCVLVVEQSRLVGIFTERDVLTKVAARDVDIDRVRVRDLMTSNPDCLHMDTELVYALQYMDVGDTRHVPVLDDRDEPVGVVSIRDILDYIVKLFPKDVLNRPPTPELQHPHAPEGA
jgi:CBS domain-containing protein